MFCPHVNQSRLERVDGMASRECKMCIGKMSRCAFFIFGGGRWYIKVRNETKVPSTTTKFSAPIYRSVNDRINLVAAKSVKFWLKYYRIYAPYTFSRTR
jgi:hypothetical protein